MSSKPNHETFLHNRLNIPAEIIKPGENKDTCQARGKRRLEKEPLVVSHDHREDDRGSSGASKKQERNANERLRRLRLHASYLTLGTLLPDHDHSSSSKKKWCAPSIIDSVITYIPKLQSEIEELTLRKQKLLELKSRGRPSIRAISVLELGGSSDEVVVQISTRKEKEDEFSNFLHVMEVQGLSILSASTFEMCQDQKVVCYNFHVKMDEKPCEGEDYITKLKNNIISWLS
ncbi:unnamed protein product [Cochlearia groenlandica]